MCYLFRLISSQDRSQLITLRVGMGKSKNMAKSGRKVTHKEFPFLKLRGSVHRKRVVRNLDARPKIHKHAQGIVHNGVTRGHTAVFDTGPQKLMIGRDGWEMIKHHYTWVDAQGVNMGEISKTGCRLQLLDARGMVKNRVDRKRYMLILRLNFFNPNLDKALLAEDQIECYGVNVYSCPRVFGGKQLFEARDQVGRSVKLGISRDGFTRYLDVRPPTRDDVDRLGSLKLTYGEPYSPYSPFRRTTRQFKLDEPCPATGRVKIVWNNEKIQEWRQHLGYFSPHLVKKTFNNSTQDYPGVRHKWQFMPKKSAVVRFTRLSDPMRGIRCNTIFFRRPVGEYPRG